jgi:hypothetical protein
MTIDELVGALRATEGEDPALAAATQLRVRRSLETRVRSRHQILGILTALAIVFGGTVSWALATGKVSLPWAPAAPRPVSEPPPPRLLPPRPAASRALVAVPTPPLPPEAVPPPALPPVRPPSRPLVRAPRPDGSAPPPIELLYRRAHALHFHGGDPAVTLAAWDAYLAAEPAGRFAIDARYNRAILLVRLGRFAEARAALGPFARGEVEPAGYRQTEAARLVERLARSEPAPPMNDRTRSGDDRP